MLNNPHVSVLGSSVAIFSGECIRTSSTADDSTSVGGPATPKRLQQQQQSPPPPPPPPTAISPQQPRRGKPKKEETKVELPRSGVQRIARHPTDPDFLAWSLLFGCCIAHPSVVLRRGAVIDVGGYDPETEPAEDYDLWLRMEASSSGCLVNTGEV